MSGAHRSFSFNSGDDSPIRSNHPDQISPLNSPDEGHQMTNMVPHNGEVSPISNSIVGGGGPQHFPLTRTRSTATPGMDNLGPAAAGGGIGGIALGVANTHDRQSGVDAFRDTDTSPMPPEHGLSTPGADNPYFPPAPPYGSSDTLRPTRDSYGSSVALGAAAASPGGHFTPGASNPSSRSLLDTSYQGAGPYDAGPYRHSAYSSHEYPMINPDEIIDDGDDGFAPPHSQAPGHQARSVAPAAAGGAAAGGVLGGLAGLFKGKKAAADSTAYGPVPGPGGLEGGEKSSWAKSGLEGGSRKRGWIVGLVLGFIVVGAIVGGAVGGIISSRKHPDAMTADTDKKTNGDLGKDSEEIQALMGNKDLHKVFPGIDYTPWGVQYPLCNKYPPSQNNVTRDMAVLSQLTNTVRLYGTDCNQTEMVLHAMDRLELKQMKLWLGVWIDDDEDTCDRQIKQLYKVLDNANDTSIFKGAIVGNEALYRAGKDTTSARKKLTNYMNDVRDHLKQHKIDIPVATSDLGDNWTEELVKVSDLVMSNIHPFFGGVPVDQAASWTWSFWQNNDGALTKGTDKKQVISETGWPSGGGNDCGSGGNCPNDKAGSVAGVDEMNQFMSDWVCQAMENGTDYFWFEAFDEPWKIQYNTKNENWEDKWGLMDAARKLKPGIKIPDCGGKTVD